MNKQIIVDNKKQFIEEMRRRINGPLELRSSDQIIVEVSLEITPQDLDDIRNDKIIIFENIYFNCDIYFKGFNRGGKTIFNFYRVIVKNKIWFTDCILDNFSLNEFKSNVIRFQNCEVEHAYFNNVEISKLARLGGLKITKSKILDLRSTKINDIDLYSDPFSLKEIQTNDFDLAIQLRLVGIIVHISKKAIKERSQEKKDHMLELVTA